MSTKDKAPFEYFTGFYPPPGEWTQDIDTGIIDHEETTDSAESEGSDEATPNCGDI